MQSQKTGVRLNLSEVADHKPEHLAEVIWYEVRSGYVGGYTVERRAIFYLDPVAWEDHPWSSGNPGGVVFQNQWSLEERYARQDSWSSTGRTGEDLGWSGLDLVQSNLHETAPGAAGALEQMIDDEISRHESILEDLAEIKSQCVEAQADRLVARD